MDAVSPIEKKKELRKKAMQLPLSPGVYIMHGKTGEIIYIGKAKALKNRVSQYSARTGTTSQRCAAWSPT